MIRSIAALAVLCACFAASAQPVEKTQPTMTQQRDIVMYMTRAIVLGYREEVMRLTRLLDQSMRGHSMNGTTEKPRVFYQKITEMTEAIRAGETAADDAAVTQSFATMLGACLDCHKAYASDKLFRPPQNSR